MMAQLGPGRQEGAPEKHGHITCCFSLDINFLSFFPKIGVDVLG
jgi:hypothetical protein